MPLLLAVARSAHAVLPHLPDDAGFTIEVVSDVRELSARIRAAEGGDAPSVIVVELHGHAAGPVAQVVRGLRERFPATPLVMMCDEEASGRDLFRAARAGADHFVFLPKGNLGSLLASLAASAGKIAELHEEHDSAIIAGLKRPARRVLEAMLDAPHPFESVSALAASLGISTRTFDRRAARHGWPAPRLLLAWGRLVRGAAAVDLASAGNSLEALLNASGLPSAEQAAHAFSRLAKVPLSAVLAQGSRALEVGLRATFDVPRANAEPRHAQARSSAA